MYLILSHIISNPYVESDMTDKFVCVIYMRARNHIDILKNGMDPQEIWKKLKYHAYDEQVVPIILNRLISNNIKRDFIIFNPTNQKVSLTDRGRKWADSECGKFAGITG